MSQHIDEMLFPPYTQPSTQPSTSQPTSANTVLTFDPHYREHLLELLCQRNSNVELYT